MNQKKFRYGCFMWHFTRLLSPVSDTSASFADQRKLLPLSNFDALYSQDISWDGSSGSAFSQHILNEIVIFSE